MSFCLLVMPFFFLAALAAIILPGPVWKTENSILRYLATSLPLEEKRISPSPALLSPAHLSLKNVEASPCDDLPDEGGLSTGEDKYDFGKSVAALDVALSDDYFEDVVFIGDSRTEGLQLYSGPQNATYYHSKGLKVDTIFSSRVVRTNSGMITIMEAIGQNPPAKVYIMLGINELGWAYSDLFIRKYTDIIRAIRKIEPGAQIYVQSILPVTQKRSQSDKIYNNENIGRYNQLIQQMAIDEGLYYLNVAECVSDEEGNLYDDASTDGIHLNKTYCDRWFNYLKYHAALPVQE